MKSGNINTRNTEKDIIVDLNVHFSSHVFKIKLIVIQDCSIAQINLLEEDDNLVVNNKLTFEEKLPN